MSFPREEISGNEWPGLFVQKILAARLVKSMLGHDFREIV
jgi:hypothetical protein